MKQKYTAGEHTNKLKHANETKHANKTEHSEERKHGNKRNRCIAVFMAMILCVQIFSGLPENIFNLMAADTNTTATEDTDTTEENTIEALLKADYSTGSAVLTAVLMDSDGNEITVADETDVSYTWYKSNGSYGDSASVPEKYDEDSFTKITDVTGSTLTVGGNGKNYCYCVIVTIGSEDDAPSYTSGVKYVTTAVAGVKIQNDIYRYGVFTAVFINSDGDILYYDAAPDESENDSTEGDTADENTADVDTADNDSTNDDSENGDTDTDGDNTGSNSESSDSESSDSEGSGSESDNSEDSDSKSDTAEKTTYCSNATYTWHRYSTAASTYVYTDPPTTEIINSGTVEVEGNKNTLAPTMGATSYYYYVTVTVGEDEYTSETRIADVYDGISVEIEQVKADNSNDITLNMIVYDDNGNVMLNEDGSYYYNDSYTTTWYKSKEYFASTGNGTTADKNSEVETSATIPLGYAPQDYYANSNYMRVTNAAYNASTNTVGYTNTLTVSDEVGRYYYVDINKNKTNGSAEAGADPVFVRNCTSTVVVEDHIAEDGTFKAVVYDADGNQVTNTDSYTYTWYKTVSGTTNYVNDKDKVKTSNSGTFVSTYSSNNGTSYMTSAYYSDSGKFTRNSGTSNKTSEYGGTLPDAGTYGLVRENFSEELQAVSDVFADANYEFDTNTNSTNKFEITDGSDSLDDDSSCSVAMDEGQLRYYYVTVKIDNNTTYTSSYKYVRYSNQIENGGFQDYTNTSASSSAFEASIMPYWETTNKGYNESYKATSSTNEQYYRMHPLLEIGNYRSSTSYGTYGNYYSYPGLTYDKDDSTKIQTSTLDDYYEMGYDDNSTTDYVYSANQFCEINSTDCNTLYQTVMTIPDMPLYWSLTHHARTSAGKSTSIINDVIYQDESGADVTASSLGASSANVLVAIDIMYVVIMNETDAEDLMSNGTDQAAQQDIIDAMVLYITTNNNAQVIQNSEDGSTYLARYDGNYTYGETKYSNISVWRVQTGSTKVEIKFGTDDDAKDAAEAAANDTNLLAYYAEKYGTVKSYSYSSTSNNVTTYYAGFYTESETYSATYDIPDGQYVSRYFFVAGSSSNSVGAGSAGSAYDDGGLTFGTYTDDVGETQTISDYNGVTKATNGTSTGNFIDNVAFSQQLDVTVNYWVYQPVKVQTTDDEGNKTTTEWKYVLQSDDTETSKGIPGNKVVAGEASDYYARYKFVGSYISADGGDEDTPTLIDEDGNSVLDTATSFQVDGDNALVLDLYYTPYDIEFEKEITGLPDSMDYSDFEDALTISVYKLDYDEETKIYSKAKDDDQDDLAAVFEDKIQYTKESTDDEGNTTPETLTLSTDYIFEKGTYLIIESSDILLTEEFDGWFSVDMETEIGALTYNEDLGGFILVIDEDENGVDSDSTTSRDGVIEIDITNLYRPIAVDCVKSVIFGSTDIDTINKALTGSDTDSNDTSLSYASLTSYDAVNSVDNTDITDSTERSAVLADDTLTYRMELTSNGESENVVVTDTVPDGCTLVEGSIKILCQKRAGQSGSHYGIVVQKLLASVEDGEKDGDNPYITVWTVTDSGTSDVQYQITYNSDTGEITWQISNMSYYEQYYVEFEVTVDQIAASSISEQLTNEADWSYLSEFKNFGDVVLDSFAMDMKEETDSSDGTTSYTVTFTNLASASVIWLKDTLPEGFVIDTNTITVNGTLLSTLTNYEVTYYNSSGDVIYTSSENHTASDIATFVITPGDNGIIATAKSADGNDSIVLTFTGKFSETESTLDGSGSNIYNTAGIKFTMSGDNTNTEYSAVVSFGEGVTNEVETDVTHLYLNIEKVIDAANDSSQTFLYKIAYYKESDSLDLEKDTPTSVTYVDINCTEAITDSAGNTTGSTGSQLVQTDRRGTYVITEIADWSVTDYEFDSSQITIPDSYAAYYLSDNTSVSDSKSVTIVLLNDGTAEDAAFPTALGSLADGTYATVSFSNKESAYAYRSAQAYARNQLASANMITVEVDCEKSVIFGSTDIDAINQALTNSTDYSGNTSLSYASLTSYDAENSVDNTGSTNYANRKAVLSGDTLTYRMALSSDGTSGNVVVTDTVPDGCTLDVGSIRILKQDRSGESGNSYGIVQEILVSSENGETDSGNNITVWTVSDTVTSKVLYQIPYDSSTKKITWTLAEISSDEQYYVEFAVTVDQLIASMEVETLKNTAAWSYDSVYMTTSDNSSSDISGTAVSRAEDTTNQVETDVTHLYIEIEQVIGEYDPTQTFEFAIYYYAQDANTSENNPTVSYVTIICTKEVTNEDGDQSYVGSTVVQTDKRGTYVIANTDWSNTDYDYATSQVTIPDTYKEYYISNDTEESGSESVMVVLLGANSSQNGAFPTILGTLGEGTYVTITFSSVEDIYAG